MLWPRASSARPSLGSVRGVVLMYHVIHEVQGPDVVLRLDEAEFRYWRDAVAEAKNLAAYRARAVRPKWLTLAVEVVSDEGEIIWSSRRDD